MTNWIPVTVTLYEQVLPTDRGERYEDPLAQLLSEKGIGEVTGGGTALADGGGIDFVDIEIDLADSDEARAEVMQLLTRLGAPKHSRLTYERDGARVEETFGVAEGVMLTLASVPADDDVGAFLDALALAAGDHFDLRGGHVMQERELVFFIYDVDAEDLWRRLEGACAASPLCAFAKVVVRCGHVDGKPRAFALPGS